MVTCLTLNTLASLLSESSQVFLSSPIPQECLKTQIKDHQSIQTELNWIKPQGQPNLANTKTKMSVKNYTKLGMFIWIKVEELFVIFFFGAYSTSPTCLKIQGVSMPNNSANLWKQSCVLTKSLTPRWLEGMCPSSHN